MRLGNKLQNNLDEQNFDCEENDELLVAYKTTNGINDIKIKTEEGHTNSKRECLNLNQLSV